ncbi:D-glycero-beta-D-manno-heptose 1-phosphate adenylyltransferase [Candidatus Omnitrophota bacterium]
MRKRGWNVRKSLAGLLRDIGTASVIVVGDVILDEYIIGDSDRISPEAPEPIITEQERKYVLGGAANVAVNITALGANAHIFGVIGDDTEGDAFRSLLIGAGVDDSGIFTVENRPTTRKTRLIARGNQVLRVDRETTKLIDEKLQAAFLDKILALSEDVVVVSDYAKGVVTPALIRALIASKKKVVVDPKSFDFGIYAGAFLITPNLIEISKSAGTRRLPPETIENVCRKLIDKHNIANILVTLGPEGMLLIENEAPAVHIHARAREVYDVTGAGDTVIAAVSASAAAGIPLSDSCFIANIAAGIVVGKHFTAITSPEEIIEYAFGQSATGKIVTNETLGDRIAELKKEGRNIVFTNGCFDLLHMGHITYLNEARELGDILVVGINSDSSVRALKGEQRPIIPEQERSHMLAALECVDYVILFDEDTPLNLIKDIQPDILVKGADYTKEEVVGHEVVESYGGSVVLFPLVENMSTSSLINRIKESH